jgi:biotin carboxyl carrier protein
VRKFAVSEKEELSEIGLENGIFETRVTRKFARRKPYQKKDPGIIKAAIPGVVAEILTKPGLPVKRGDILLILEAMKMLNRIMAPLDGEIKAIRVKKGEKVVKDQVLIELTSAGVSPEGGRNK